MNKKTLWGGTALSKRIGLIAILVLIGIIAISSYSYAYLKKEIDTGTRIDFEVGTLTYNLESSDLTNNQITIEANSYKNVIINITSNNSIDSKYELYYNLITNLTSDEKNNIEIGHFEDVSVNGTINKNSIVKTSIKIKNNLNKSIIIEFGVQGGLPKAEFVLTDGNRINKLEYVNYNEEILNGADPVLSDNLIPITIDNNGTVKKADISEAWYSYENKNWANVVVLEDNTTKYYTGEVIPEDNIESYFVWIPKYSYKIWDLGNYNGDSTIDSSKNKPIEITFGLTDTSDSVDGQCTTPMLSGESGNCDVGEYMTHPAFISMNSNGLWVGKFETGYDGATSTGAAQINNSNSSAIIIKPNVYSWRSIQPANASTASLNYMTSENSHMMKNTEWGAVAYLTNSVYGTCNDTTCNEVRINNNSAYITGYAAIASDTTSYSSTSLGVDGTDTLNYLNPLSNVASTTGNYTGIYDMSGGAWEYVMGVLAESTTSTTPLSGRHNLHNSGFNGVFSCPTCDSTTSGVDSSILSLTTGINFPDIKYYDVYKYSTSGTAYLNRILGDATGELGPFNSRRSSYNSDYAYFVYSNNPWFLRGGHYGGNTGAGVFGFTYGSGIYGSNSFRLVLAPNAS